MEDAFASYHPAVEFFFFLGAVGGGMFFIHPLFVGLSVAAAAVYYCLLLGRKSGKRLCGLLLLWLFSAALNALLVQEGETVLFTFGGGRTVTKEALCYGLSGGAAFVSVLLWFSCYSEIMTSDKFICLFGSRIPAVSLLLSMILRLIPNFEGKAAAVTGARRCIGKAPDNGNRREKLLHSTDLLSVLTSWALEGAVVTADSMKSRGYGTGERTSFSVYRRSARDIAVFAVLLVSFALLLFGASHGAVRAEFYPTVTLGGNSIYTMLGALGYAVFLFTPSFLHIREEVTWTILRSRI